MADMLNKKMREVWIKYSINLFLEQAGRFLLLGGIAAVAAILIERLFGLQIINVWAKWGIWVVLVILISIFWIRSLPSRMQVSVLAYNRLHFKERFSTALLLAKSQDPFSQAACDEAHKAAENVEPAKQFPLRLSHRWIYTVAAWGIFVLTMAYMPQKDLLGFIRNSEQKQQEAQVIAVTQKQIEQTAKEIAAVVKQLDANQMDSELAQLAQMPSDLSPDAAKRQAIEKLGVLADKVEQMQQSVQQQSVDILKSMLKQMKSSQAGELANVRMALAKGDFSQASKLLQQLQKQVEEGGLSDQQKKDLAEQLQNLAKEMKNLAEKQKAIEDELQKMGLDKSLAKMDKEQLQKALQDKGLSSEKVEQLMDKMEASRQAAGRMSSMAEAMASAGSGGLSGSDFAEAMEQLSELESLEMQSKLSQATLDEIERAIAGLGDGMCNGIGGQRPFSEGQSNRMGSGTGGPGMGFGPRDSDTQGDTSTTSTKVKGQTDKGPSIASWYIKGGTVRGEAKKEFSDVMQSAKDRAAEAINENVVPKKYEESVRKYFGIEQSSGKE